MAEAGVGVGELYVAGAGVGVGELYVVAAGVEAGVVGGAKSLLNGSQSRSQVLNQVLNPNQLEPQRFLNVLLVELVGVEHKLILGNRTGL